MGDKEIWMEKENPKVSVIVPVYGVERYIERCAHSLFQQTFESIEYIFVDDCTKDDSMKILASVMSEYPNRHVKIVHKEENGGLPQARCSGVAYAQGEYVLHIDSDDWVELDMVERLYSKAVETQAEMVCCGWIEEYGDHSIRKEPYIHCVEDYYESVLALETDAYIWCRLVKRELFQGVIFPINNMFEDYVITSQLLGKCHTISFVQSCLYHYIRSNVNSIRASAETKRILIQEIHNINIVYQQIKHRYVKENKSRTLGRMLFAMGWHALRRNLFGELSAEEIQSIRDGVLQQIPNENLDFPMWKQMLMTIIYRIKK